MGVPGKVGSCVTSSEMKKKNKKTTLCVYCFSVFVRTVGSPPLGPLKDCWRGQFWFSRTCDSIISGRVLTKIAVRA